MKSSVTQSRLSKPSTIAKQTKPKQKSKNYLDISNEQFLRRNLMLLGASQASFQKQAKISIEAQYFPKHQMSPTSTKQFFYITYFCLQKLCTEEEMSNIQMWYPPRTVNEQLQYKKILYKMIQNLQNWGRVPKNMLVSKAAIMGQATNQTIVEFLRFLSEMSLRHQFLQQFSKRDKLIQICVNHTNGVAENDINRFYIHPFVPSVTATSFDHPSLDLNQIKQTFHYHIKQYMKKLVKLRTKNMNPVLAQIHQNLMKNYMQQKQISDTLSERIPAAVLSQNRAFDRRRLIDRNIQIWDELDKIQCHFIQQKQVPVLKIQGQIDQLLQKWQPIKGMSNILQANTILKNTGKMRKQVNESILKFRELCKNIENQIKS